MAPSKEFTPLVPPKDVRPRSAFFGPSGRKNMLRDQLTITSWLALGALIQGLAFLVLGRLALLPAAALVFYRVFVIYAQSVGWLHNTFMDGVIMSKFSSQLPDENGKYGSVPAKDDVVVFLIGTRFNHPLGLLAPGVREFGGFMSSMIDQLDKEGFEDYLGSTSWLNAGTRDTSNELLIVQYWRSTEGLHKYANGPLHRESWDWFNRNTKAYPHLAIYHETFKAPAGNHETIYLNSHASHLASTTTKVWENGEEKWASPMVDASRGLLRTHLGRMTRGTGEEHAERGVKTIYE
ncbi:hypothetical protein BAUCODRAFT_118116 [Baudoinia panamericana UAMH 10762]|uniref:Uncharacterized protein n=1 Tax=Baudoinia panamericana (strain UAMH 10762) TaxID=717646 RepID=M2MHY6_BAUPA|nr:uncharacterized protein BAUCODRAFT_118116 [Baudoinia panamericana UAMH 10762]EMC90873.1 hypothetical protein BAUCODRAFT_118116 [Baudoinia panamericana UAMH 10762]